VPAFVEGNDIGIAGMVGSQRYCLSAGTVSQRPWRPMTRFGFEYILRKHVHTAVKRCPSLSTKRVSPHVLRHTCALTLLQATNDLRKVALWLGHANMQTTEMYTRTDPSIKLEALESVVAPKTDALDVSRQPTKLIAEITDRYCYAE